MHIWRRYGCFATSPKSHLAAVRSVKKRNPPRRELTGCWSRFYFQDAS
jgi:hypothetical protein